MPKSGVTPESFITAWNKSECIREVCEKTGLGYHAAHSRATKYRKAGLALKTFQAGNPNFFKN